MSDTEFAPHEVMENHRGKWVQLEAVEKRVAALREEIENLRTAAVPEKQASE